MQHNTTRPQRRVFFASRPKKTHNQLYLLM
nr:MAG TPA: hypothetical protein [Caudoviricetes sp.]